MPLRGLRLFRRAQAMPRPALDAFMAHSGPPAESLAMRIAAMALACLLAAGSAGVAAEPQAVGAPQGFLSPMLPGKPAGASPDARAYAPDKPQLSRFHDQARPPHGRVCFNQAETREKIAAHRLADPVRALRLGRSEGEALSAKLCRWQPDEFVYEVHVLRRDGRVLRVFMNAQSGETVSPGAVIPGVLERDKDRK